MTTATKPRYEFLDWLRVIAILILVFFHTGMLFTGWGWHVENAETIQALHFPMDISHRLRMPLLFVIAGASMWFALRSRSIASMVSERSQRLLLPAAAGMFLIVPPQIWYERLYRGQWSGGYLDFFFERVLQFQPYPQGDFSWHHLWFIVYLYVYALLLIPLLTWLRGRESALRPGPWLYALALPLAINEALLKPLFPESHNLVSDWYIFNHYLMLTLYGLVLARISGGWDWLMQWRRRTFVAVAVLFAAAMIGFETGIVQRDTPADAFIANLFTWWTLLAFLGYGRRYLSFENGLLRWSRDASYPIYILHQTVIVALGYYVVQTAWNPWTKYWVVLTVTLIVCVIAYEFAIRRFAVARLLFGMKAKAGAGRHSLSPGQKREHLADSSSPAKVDG